MSPRLLPGIGLAASLSLVGAAAGGLVGGRLLDGSGMGWNQLANMLGGMMVGGGVGLVAGVVLARTLEVRTLRRVAAGSCIAALLLIAAMALKISAG
ncbi:MAG TPA: hypothetical protein VEW03_03965 [Longimicrobiaceae bacterium]|nr:hypothetical protein [Longimicrobiaceae bacterium]